MKQSFLFFFLFFIYQIATSQSFLRADGQRIVNDKGENILLRGVGLGGWMLQEGYMLKVNAEGQQHKIKARIEKLVGTKKTNEFYESWLSNNTIRADIDSLKVWGFNSVRLPMHYNLYTLPVEEEPDPEKNTWLEKGFAMTDSLIEWCKANELYLILDLHAAPGGQGNDLNISDRDPSKPSLWESEANQKKTVALWRKLAERYVGEPWIGGYDLINEPNWGFQDPVNDKNGLKETGNEPLRKLLMDITRAVREVDKKHIIIIEGNGWGNNYNGMFPLWDDNMVVSFHKYWNFNNVESISHILETRSKYNVPVWLGETGENSNVWYTEAIHLLESHNIGWAWWPLKKLGNNNPLEIRTNPEYQKILAYWRGGGARPSPTQAYRGIIQLAKDANIRHNIIHYDVLDAMMRQPHSMEARPFKQHKVGNGLRVNAVDYDLGRTGVAYYDLDTADYHISDGSTGGNKGRKYRNDGVDIRSDSVLKNFVVFSIEDGEWLQYSLNADKPGIFKLVLTILGNDTGGKLEISLNGLTTETLSVKPGRKWSRLSTIPMNFKPGNNELRILVKKGGFDFEGFELISAER